MPSKRLRPIAKGAWNRRASWRHAWRLAALVAVVLGAHVPSRAAAQFGPGAAMGGSVSISPGAAPTFGASTGLGPGPSFGASTTLGPNGFAGPSMASPPAPLAYHNGPAMPSQPSSAFAPANNQPVWSDPYAPPAPAESCASCVEPELPLGELLPTCDECQRDQLIAFVSYDSFRSIVDGSWQNNGIVVGGNYGTRLGKFSEWTGIGAQLGGSVGIFDWSGTDYRQRNQDEAETQGFITYGLFKHASDENRFSGALVQDWMLNNTYGVFGQNPTLSQCRWYLGYATSAANEFGFWGTFRGQGATRNVRFFGSTRWRSVNQFNIFWRHKWTRRGADSMIYVGIPEDRRLTGNGSLGNWLAGLSAQAPLNNAVALYSLVTYMHPSAGAGGAASLEEQWNFTVGLALYPRRDARASTVAGQCWAPLLPVANNGYFLVDTNHTY